MNVALNLILKLFQELERIRMHHVFKDKKGTATHLSQLKMEYEHLLFN